MSASTGKKGGAKIGRGMKSPSHSSYNSTGRYEINKIRRLKKHLKKCKKDKVALKCLRKFDVTKGSV